MCVAVAYQRQRDFPLPPNTRFTMKTCSDVCLASETCKLLLPIIFLPTIYLRTTPATVTSRCLHRHVHSWSRNCMRTLCVCVREICVWLLYLYVCDRRAGVVSISGKVKCVWVDEGPRWGVRGGAPVWVQRSKEWCCYCLHCCSSFFTIIGRVIGCITTFLSTLNVVLCYCTAN